ncbi:carboxypeptidase-like regulatory domain-containing protein [Mesonia sp. K7]|uniref:carboxypeptidase-like regulatory domain-containing protein n=1 Tax=Mesonia sp. K7 TaxID=2218606 RepID=UPI000DA75AA2|nr:carboxypeptidase-like regulatory domain-containing protein [Mesonia sp. K7]PZD77002.1 hypothetical protein DNG35_10185 [Mesonia sp. K7]
MRLKIDIPEPCSESWQKMTPNQDGRFCDSCQKTVVDFTKFSDRELLHYIKGKDQLCGRFYQNQLKEYQANTSAFQLSSRWSFALSLFTFLGISSPIFAQTSNPKTEQTDNKSWKSVLPQKKSLQDSITFTGTVTDDQAMPLPGVNVVLKGTTIGTQTDFDGNFSLKVSKKDVPEKIDLFFSYVGFDTQEKRIKNKNENINISLEQGPALGGVVVYSYKKQNIFRRTGNFFKRLFTKKEKETCEQ